MSWKRVLAPLLAVCLQCTASAAPQPVFSDDVMHEVKQGDTLSFIAQRYLGDGDKWRDLARLNRLREPNHLKPGSAVRIPAAALPSIPAAAKIVALTGQARGRRVGEEFRPLAVGAEVGEGDLLELGPGSFATLTMPDGGTIHLQGQASVRMRSLRLVPVTGAQRTVLEMDKGRIDVDVPKSEPGGRFDVRTPLAVAGVRGTRFGVTAREGQPTTLDVTRGAVAVNRAASSVSSEQRVQAGKGVVVRPGAEPLVVQVLKPAPDLAAVLPVYERPSFEIIVPRLAGAATVRLQLARDAEFRQVLLSREEAQSGDATRLAMPRLDDGNYFLSVRGIDGDGLAGLVATARFEVRARPEPPLQQQPQEQGELLLEEATLVCAEVPGARAYDFRVVPVGSGQRALERRVSDQCRWSLPGGMNAGAYDWQVATVIAEGPQSQQRRGPFGDPRRFTLVKRPAAAAAEMSVAGQSADLAWPRVAGLRYEVQLAADQAFATRPRMIDVPASFKLHLDLDGCATHFVRWRAVTDHGWRSDWSAPQRLSIAPTICTSDGLPVRASDDRAVQTP